MKQVAPRISGEATMWKVWIGIHVSHSMGLVLFGLIYGYLALPRWDVLLRSHFLIGLGLLWLVGHILLAQIYWFRIPLIGVSLATLFWGGALVQTTEIIRERKSCSIPTDCRHSTIHLQEVDHCRWRLNALVSKPMPAT
jgi:hypothetical protein